MLLIKMSYEQHVHNLTFMDEIVGMNTKSSMGGVVEGQWSGGRLDSFILIRANHEMSCLPLTVQLSFVGNLFLYQTIFLHI